EESGVDLAFEASVGGGIPLVRPLKESLAGERVTRLVGILNGTTNYILTRMTEDEMAFDEALAEAQALGYAEADPSADVGGHDAAAKCAILASIAFNARVTARDVFREGIERVAPEDIRNAELLGYVIKPVAIAELEDDDVAVRVHPAMIPSNHPLAAVREAFNAVFVEGKEVGELMLYGRGAGGGPTATAVVGDLVRVSRNLVLGGRGLGCTCYLDRSIRPMEEMEGAYYLLLDVEDRPGAPLAGRDRGVPRPPSRYGGHAGGDPAGGRHSSPSLGRPVRRDRVRGVPEVRGHQSHGIVQGPGHDGGHIQGAGGRGQGRGVRIDGQHERVGRRVRRTGRADLRRAGAQGEGRGRKAGPDHGPRSQGPRGGRQLRPGL